MVSKKAVQGDPIAQNMLGIFLEANGFYTEAATWYRKAADQGMHNAQGSLGSLFLAGRGVPEDFGEASKWSLAAANQGDPQGMLNLAVINTVGQGHPVNYTEGVKWARKAAEEDCEKKGRPAVICAQAQSLLAAGYLDGHGVPQDYVQAHMWANLAAATLPADQRKDAVDVRDAAARKMTPEQIGEAQRLAREWKPIGTK
jgi:TPR repeat protein